MSTFRLCDAAFVADALRSGQTVLLEAHFTSLDHPLDPDLPNTQHIPGAIQMHPSYLEAGTRTEKYYPFYACPADGNLLPHPDLVSALMRLGITPDRQVIVYGTEPDGPMAAARIAWGLIYAGVKEVCLLDGGIQAWLEDAQAYVSSITTATERGENLADPAPLDGAWIAREETRATIEEVKVLSEQPRTASGKLVDVRNAGEWSGTTPDYYTFFTDAGHIPNSYFQGDWDLLLERRTQKIGPNLEAVARHWKTLGILTPDVEAGEQELIFYCGTGWRSSLAFLVARLLGLRARNFDDGFYGWSQQEDLPIAFAPAPRPGQPSNPE